MIAFVSLVSCTKKEETVLSEPLTIKGSYLFTGSVALDGTAYQFTPKTNTANVIVEEPSTVQCVITHTKWEALSIVTFEYKGIKHEVKLTKSPTVVLTLSFRKGLMTIK